MFKIKSGHNKSVQKEKCSKLKVFKMESVQNEKCWKLKVFKIKSVHNEKNFNLKVFKIISVQNEKCSKLWDHDKIIWFYVITNEMWWKIAILRPYSASRNFLNVHYEQF